MTYDDGGASVLLPGEGKTVSFSDTFFGNRVTFVYREPDAAYSIVSGPPRRALQVRRTFTGRPTKGSTSLKAPSTFR